MLKDQSEEVGPLSLNGKVTLVTGAGKRVGAAIAERLGHAGMKVGVHYNGSREGAEQVAAKVREAGGEAQLFQANLYDRDSARTLVNEVATAFGGLDLLVASAANFDRVAFDAIDDAAWDRALALNVTAPFVLAQAATPYLKASNGAIVIITCTSTTVPYRHYLPYVVSKGAVKQLMRTLALELAPQIRVNGIAPGTVLPPEDLDDATLLRLQQSAPLQRFGNPADIAEAVAYLASARFVTGQELAVDGGRTLGARSLGNDPI